MTSTIYITPPMKILPAVYFSSYLAHASLDDGPGAAFSRPPIHLATATFINAERRAAAGYFRHHHDTYATRGFCRATSPAAR